MRARKDIAKAEVARRARKKAPAVSRLFAGEGINPTVGTITEMAAAVGLHVTLLIEDNPGGLAPPLEVVAKV